MAPFCVKIGLRMAKYEACPESKQISRVGRKGNFYAYYGNTAVDLDPLPAIRARLRVVESASFEWDVFEMVAPIQNPAKCEVRSVIRFLNAKGERPTEIHKQIVAVCGNVMNRQIVTKWCSKLSEGSSTTMVRCKKVMTRFKGRRQTAMTRGYRSLFQDLINVWTMPANKLKNKVMYRQFIESVAFVN
jgi:hypothetical protein